MRPDGRRAPARRPPASHRTAHRAALPPATVGHRAVRGHAAMASAEPRIRGHEFVTPALNGEHIGLEEVREGHRSRKTVNDVPGQSVTYLSDCSSRTYLESKLPSVFDALQALVCDQTGYSRRARDHDACRAAHRCDLWIIDAIGESTLYQVDAAARPVRHRALCSELSLLCNSHLSFTRGERVQARTLAIVGRCGECLATSTE